MSLTKLVLRYAAPLPEIEKFQRYLFLGPHPDDIEIGAGATAAKLAAAGKELCFLICTDGRYGTDHAPAELRGQALADRRREEAERSAAVLGIMDLRFLPNSDGGFYEMRDLLRGIAQAVSDFRPDVIFAPDPCVISECHPDHRNVGRAAMEIACLAPNGGIMAAYGAEPVPVKALALYMTDRPNRFVGISAADLETQRKSVFSCHKSQFPDGCPAAEGIKLYLKLRSADFGIRSLKGRAEGFRVLGPTQMHCLPEAGK